MKQVKRRKRKAKTSEPRIYAMLRLVCDTLRQFHAGKIDLPAVPEKTRPDTVRQSDGWGVTSDKPGARRWTKTTLSKHLGMSYSAGIQKYSGTRITKCSDLLSAAVDLLELYDSGVIDNECMKRVCDTLTEPRLTDFARTVVQISRRHPCRIS
jgi:hypothetical protein